MSDGNPFVADFNEHADFGVQYGRVFLYQDEDGDPIPTNTYTAVLKIRQDYNTPVLLSLTGVTNVDGTVSFSSTDEQMQFQATAQYATWAGVYDVLLLSSGNPAVKLIRGTFTLHPTASV